MRRHLYKVPAIIALLAGLPGAGSAQSLPSRPPASQLDADLPLAPLTWREVTQDRKDFTQVILTSNYSSSWDTAEVFRVSVDPRKKTYTYTSWKYEDLSERDLEGFDNPGIIRMTDRTRRTEGDRTIYRYGEDGLLRSKQDYDLLPEKTFSNLYFSFMAMVSQEEEASRYYNREEEEDGSDSAEEKRRAYYRRRFDSLAATPLPERADATEDDAYTCDAAGNLLHRRSRSEKNEYWYHYRRDAAGRVSSKRVAYLSRANEGTYLSGYEFQYEYGAGDRLRRLSFYSWERDSSESARPAEPAIVEENYYGQGGRLDSMHIRQGIKTIRHLYQYQDTLPIAYVTLERYPQGNGDTLRQLFYRYRGGEKSEEISLPYYSGKQQRETEHTLYYYNSKGDPVEVQTLVSSEEEAGGERMTRRDLFFYGDGNDAATARRFTPPPRMKPPPVQPQKKNRPRRAAETQQAPVVRPEPGEPVAPEPGIETSPAVIPEAPQVRDSAGQLNNVTVLSSQKPVFIMVEQMPLFSGDNAGQASAALDDFLRDQLRRPAGVPEGKVIVRFIVRSDGSITDASVYQGLSPAADAEALRLVRSMPPWRPGKQNGVAVDVYYNLPIRFSPKPQRK